MAKLKNPLLSLGAIGRLGEGIVFVRRRLVNIVEKKPIPASRATEAQVAQRGRFLEGVALWHALSAEEKREWQAKASRHHMTGYPYFLSKNIPGPPAPPPPPPEEERYEYYIAGADGASGIASNNWGAQTFTPQVSHQITKVKLKVYREHTPNNFVVEIRTTEPDGSPTDIILCSKVFNSEPITQVSPGEWYEFAFDTTPTLDADTLYAIVLHRAPPVHAQAIFWRRQSVGDPYPRGTLCWSTNAGGTWLVQGERDYMFEDWGLVT